MCTPHPFDSATTLNPVAAGLLRGHPEPRWANMVGPFGGITAATILRAIEVQSERIGQPVALTVNFAAPIGSGEFEIAVEVARSNRSTQHWIARLRQNGETNATATALFGTLRESWCNTEAEPPAVLTPEQAGPQEPSTFAPWLRNYDMRIVAGAAPSDASQATSASTTTLWVRDNPTRSLDHVAMAALCDVFYPRIFLRRGGFVPAGTVSMTTYFHADHRHLQVVGEDFVLGRARANSFGGGFFDQSAMMWSRSGALLSTTHQIVYFKG